MFLTHCTAFSNTKTISKVYNDLSGFGSIQQTLEEASKIDKTITLNDVKAWKGNNIVRKTNLKGYNSYIASEPRGEYQVDPCLLYTSPSPRDS